MEYFVYILLCNDNTYYTGVTNDIERRFIEHAHGYNPTAYTFSRRPVKLAWKESFSNIEYAIEIEKKLKKWSAKKKKALIDENFSLLKELSACKNETSSLLRKNKLESN
jgi:putative endonuclease